MTAENGENTGRIRRSRRGYRQWTEEQKRQIVAETDKLGASVSVVARRHDVNANQLFSWRRQYQRGKLGSSKAVAALVPIGIIGEGGIVSSVSDYANPKGPRSSVACLDARRTSLSSLCAPHSESTPIAAAVVQQPKLIEVELRSGTRIRIDGGVKGAALQQVLKLIRSLAASGEAKGRRA